MANEYKPVAIQLGSNRSAILQIRSDIVTYFGFTAETSNEVVVTRRRKAHTRAVYSGLADTTATTTNVEASTWQAIKRAAESGSGKAIKVPTKLKNSKQNTRFVTIRVPNNATVAAISEFLYGADASKRPDYFIMPSGARYPVVNVTGDVNPGEGTAPST